MHKHKFYYRTVQIYCNIQCIFIILRMLIIENFIPHEEKNKLMNRAYFDEDDEETWKLQQLTKHG